MKVLYILTALFMFILLPCFTIAQERSSEPREQPPVEGPTEFNDTESGTDEEDETDFDSDEENKAVSLKAHVKNLITRQKVKTYSVTGKEKNLVGNLSRLRLSPEIQISDFLLIHADCDNELVTGNYLKTVEFDNSWRRPYSDYNELVDLSKEGHYDEDLLYRAKVHRAFLKLVLGDFTLTVGKQQIRFGSGRLWNPLDILNPISPLSLEGHEEQKGTDAVRAEYFLNEYTVFSLIYDQKRTGDRDRVSDLEQKNASYIGRFKTSVFETEIAALGGRLLRKDVGGIDISTILFKGTLRGSALKSKPDEYNSYIQASAGYEYNFSSGLYFLMEYFYNQNGMNFNDPLKYAFISSQMLGIDESNYYLLANQFLTFNKHYAGIALGYDITALLRAEFFFMYDFQGKGIFINPSLKYNVFQDVDLFISFMKSYLLDGAKYSSDFEYLDEYPLLYAYLKWFIL